MLGLLSVVLIFSTRCYGVEFTHHAVLDPNEKYEMWWKFDDEEITIKLRVETRGWIGWGLSPNGNMVGSDVMLAWFDSDGKGKIQDGYAEKKSRPVADKNQSIELIEMKKEGGNTTVIFKRKLQLCDDDDRSITGDTMRIIYAYGDSQEPSYHGDKRNSHSLYLLDYSDKYFSKTELPPDTISREYRLSEKLPLSAKDTQYVCAGFEIGITGKHHLIRIEPIVKKGHENLVHHIILYECRGLNDTYKKLIEQHTCDLPNMPEHLKGCLQVAVHGWAIGGTRFDYPKDVGFPIGRPEDAKHFFLEIHYDNPKKIPNLTDNSGLRLYFTKTLRPYDAGSLTVGTTVGHEFLIIPQNQTEFKWTGFCSSKCLNVKKIKPKIFASILHTHIQGRKIIVRLVRDSDGVEVKRINEDLNYDFNYQEAKYLKEEYEIPEGHSIHVECFYDTTNHSSPLVGGESTRQEMCLAYLLHYPPIDNRWCTSVNLPGLGDFQYNEFNWNMNEDGVIDQSVVINGQEYNSQPAWKTLTNPYFWKLKDGLVEKWQQVQELPGYFQSCRNSHAEFYVGVIQPKLNQTLKTEQCVSQSSKGIRKAKPFYLTMIFCIMFLIGN